MVAKKGDLIEAENRLERKHWLKTKFSTQRALFASEGQMQGIRDKDRR
jgi:hypothetical protein